MDSKEAKKKLNEMYDQVDQIDIEIDKLRLRRKMLLDKIEAGLALLMIRDKERKRS